MNKMQEELKVVKKNYKKIKILFDKDLEIEELVKIKTISKDEIIKSLLIVKENILLVPIIDKHAKLDKIVNQIDALININKEN